MLVSPEGICRSLLASPMAGKPPWPLEVCGNVGGFKPGRHQPLKISQHEGRFNKNYTSCCLPNVLFAGLWSPLSSSIHIYTINSKWNWSCKPTCSTSSMFAFWNTHWRVGYRSVRWRISVGSRRHRFASIATPTRRNSAISAFSSCRLFHWVTVLPLNLRSLSPSGNSLPFSTHISNTLPTWTFFPAFLALSETSFHSDTVSWRLVFPGCFLDQFFPSYIGGLLCLGIGPNFLLPHRPSH